jgi:CDP-diacylglycerol--glycerol-3-phosphate 3-phosphatidyltransferase
VALGFGLVVSPLFVATLWVMFALTSATAIYRFIKVWRQASGQPPLVRRPIGRRTRRRSARPVSDMRARAQARAEARRRRRSQRT